MEFAQDATWWFSPLHRMTTNKMCFTTWGLSALDFTHRRWEGPLFLQNIENQWCHCDFWLHWWIGLMLFMEFAQNATWWFSPLHRMTTKNGVLQDEVCQHWSLLTGVKRDLFSAKYWKSMFSLCLVIALMDRVKVIHGVCPGCHLMVFTTS
jgi:hypothetical protein